MIRFSYIATLFKAVDVDFRKHPLAETIVYDYASEDEKGNDVAAKFEADRHLPESLYRMRNMLAAELVESGEQEFVERVLAETESRYSSVRYFPGNVHPDNAA